MQHNFKVWLFTQPIPNFQSLTHATRRLESAAYRNTELLRLQKQKNNDAYKQAKKNFIHTNAYVHLTFDQRKALIHDLARCISNWGFARLFAECIDKVNFPALNSVLPPEEQRTIDEQALEQVVSRFEYHLRAVNNSFSQDVNALLIHDNNHTVAKKHTDLMKKFHSSGTLWTSLKHVVETPLFVDSQLTSMVQIADLCCYALRHYLEKKEDSLFDLIFARADRRDGRVVGIRHFTKPGCECKICLAHKGQKHRPEKPLSSSLNP